MRQFEDSQGTLRRDSNVVPSAQAKDPAKHTAAAVPPKDSDDVSVTNSEVESVINHRRRRESLRHVTFTDQEFNTFNSVNAYLGAARTGLDGVAGLFAAKVQVYNQNSLRADHVP